MPFSRFSPLFGAHRFCSASPNDFSTCRMFGIRFSMYWADANFWRRRVSFSLAVATCA